MKKNIKIIIAAVIGAGAVGGGTTAGILLAGPSVPPSAASILKSDGYTVMPNSLLGDDQMLSILKPYMTDFAYGINSTAAEGVVIVKPNRATMVKTLLLGTDNPDNVSVNGNVLKFSRPFSGSASGTQTPSTGQVSTPAAPSISGQLAWSHMNKGVSSDDQEARYVVKVTNSGSSPASLHLEAKAVDATGTDVGDDNEALPAIPGHSQAYFYSCIGCTGFSTLTGTPVKVSVAFTPDDVAAGPMLQTSEVTMKPGDATYADLPHAYAYDMTVKVTNTTGETMTGGVQQEGVLFNQAGQVVGGFGIGSSDNVPDTLAPGESYREDVSTMEAVQTATRVEYAVWAD